MQLSGFLYFFLVVAGCESPHIASAIAQRAGSVSNFKHVAALSKETDRVVTLASSSRRLPFLAHCRCPSGESGAGRAARNNIVLAI